MSRAQTKVIIAVDTSIVKNGTTEGIYMMDNRAGLGSTNEGAGELSTICDTGDFVSWEAVVMDPYTTDTVAIQGFQVSQGNVFGENGKPAPVPGHDNRVWQGRAENAGSQTYQVSLQVTQAGQPVAMSWDPFLTAR